jgi:FAD/FMN-containing dehydrogenase
VVAVRRSVRSAAARGRAIKAVGAGHSFTGIAVAPGTLLDLSDLSGLVSVDRERARVRLLAVTALIARPRAAAERTDRRTAEMVVGYSTSWGRTFTVRPRFCQVPPGTRCGSGTRRAASWPNASTATT